MGTLPLLIVEGGSMDVVQPPVNGELCLASLLAARSDLYTFMEI
jgi:hypothetical protein